ncbi:hypothetical protein ACFWWT_26310 [Streptomyces sp. NPDC058676]|uniref:hypothetical protein n=1 Tax=unclassified Streptomyces TaxID=2593676 RepID=UPI003651FD70
MDSTVIVWILAWAGVLSVVIFVAKGLLDQLPPLVDSWRALVRAMRGEETTKAADEARRDQETAVGPDDIRPAPPTSHQ